MAPFILLDAHVHLDMYSDAQLPVVLERLAADRILALSVSIDPVSFERTRTIAAGSDFVVPGFGIHPWEAHKYDGRMAPLTHLFDVGPFVGEIGLDYRWVDDQSRYPAQRRVFEYQLNVAREQDKLINVHTAGAEDDVVAIVEDHGVTRGVIHWYSGPHDALRKLIELGFMFTIGVQLLLSDSIREFASLLPTDQILTETDNPGGLEWLTGVEGMPGDLSHVLEELATIRGVAVIDMADTVRANFARLVDGDPHLAPWRSRLGS